MSRSLKIVMVGGGSVNWGPKLINDMTLTKGLENSRFVLLDTDLEAAQKMAKLGKKLAKERELSCSFEPTDNDEVAFRDVDYVIITISTGGLNAMEHDLKIPEEYGIYQTVGDTVGPGGWARSLRNIPVFVKMAKKIEEISPKAVVINYTNPLSVLTNTFYKVSNLSVVGLCHGLFECYEVLMKIFNLKDESEIKLSIGGINHFFWITALRIRGEDGYELLRKTLHGRNFAELIEEIYTDEAGFNSDKWVTGELLKYFGYLPYVGDRHICEFFPHYLTPDETDIKKYKLKRTSIEERRERRKEAKKRLEDLIVGKEKLPEKPSRETAARIISTMAYGGEFVDVVNLPNRGQILNLPEGSIVETLGVVNSNGFTPLSVGNLPVQIRNLVLPHVENQNLIVEAGIRGDWEKALLALYNDPLCSHLNYPQVKEIGEKLLEANREYLPQFFGSKNNVGL